MARAFTLLDLLTAMVIIATLALLSLGAIGLVRTQIKTDSTKFTIEKLDQIIAQKWHQYVYRRLPTANPSDRLNAIRDLIRMEMPDRWSDVTDGPVCLYETNGYVDRRPSLSKHYLRIYYQALNRAEATVDNQGNPISPQEIQRKVDAVGANAAAECLYLIVMSNPNDINKLREDEIADTDGDGLMEFVDAWGQPIRFLRWAPGFKSPKQSLDSIIQHDPFDLLHVDNPTSSEPYRGSLLYPLIYSAGPDGVYDINIGDGFNYSIPDPYRRMATGLLIGEPFDEFSDRADHHDNVTNHKY